MTTSQKVILFLGTNKMTKTELSKKLGISRPTLNDRISSNTWINRDIIILKHLKVI